MRFLLNARNGVISVNRQCPNKVIICPSSQSFLGVRLDVCHVFGVGLDVVEMDVGEVELDVLATGRTPVGARLRRRGLRILRSLIGLCFPRGGSLKLD